MHKTIEIWDRKFNLPVVFDCYKDEEILDIQLETLNEFKPSHKMLENCKNEILKLLKNETDEKEVNIFKYDTPKNIYIVRDKNVKTVGIVCAYKFDMEHGLAFLFKNNKFIKLGAEDILY